MLGRLEKVNLRDVWKHEAYDFSTWVSKEENINLLSDTVGIDIEVIETEASVGSFSVDILAKDPNDGSKIIIENQLERTDHDHLGKIITYASGYDAKTIIWIVKSVREEHKKAVEWLNNHLDDEINIFLIKIEVWKIGDSKPAPKFDLVESPNNWAKVIKNSPSRGKETMTDAKSLQLEFWTKLVEYGEDNNRPLKFQTPKAKHWCNSSMGTSQYHLSITVNSKLKELRSEIYIPDNKEAYHKFYDLKNEIENELGFNLEWMELPNKKASRIIAVTDFDINQKEEWQDAEKWVFAKAEKMKEIFTKYKNK